VTFHHQALNIISSARGNTSLESAVSLTRALRWDIQSLGVRLSKAANTEELSRRGGTRSKTLKQHEAELRFIVDDIRELITRIEDAVPLINLAITTSGAKLSTTLPPTVSPSRLLQASTFLTAGDTAFSISPNQAVQIGPTFVLSVYMLFMGHAREHSSQDNVRDTTWKEVIHKAKVKLIRVPLSPSYDSSFHDAHSFIQNEAPCKGHSEYKEDHNILKDDEKTNEFAYQLEIVEDFDDGRVHSFDNEETQPSVYKDVLLAGIRELLPIHQISKIFYADTGKILNIGNEGGANNPILLLKRDINAVPPRRMMEHSERGQMLFDNESDGEIEDDPQYDIDHQLRSESSILIQDNGSEDSEAAESTAWRFPPNLDLEWVALEVFTEPEEESSEDEHDSGHNSTGASASPVSSGTPIRDVDLTADLESLRISSTSSSSAVSTPNRKNVSPPKAFSNFTAQKSGMFGQIQSSLSLLEMLIRLTALQQFQQASHLSIPDELLTFFLEESSTTGAGGDGDERRRKRFEARKKVGFDPYDESPVKRRGEDYQYQYRTQQDPDGDAACDFSYEEYGHPTDYPISSRQWSKPMSGTPQDAPDSWLPRSRIDSVSSRIDYFSGDVPPSPASPYVPKKSTRPFDRLKQERWKVKGESPLGRGMSVETDSSLGTSPGTPSAGRKF
jgi:hypothetical protein